MLRFELDIVKITCPECHGVQYIKYLEAKRCVHCNHPLDSYDDEDLQEQDATVTVAVNQLTGEAQILSPLPKEPPRSPLFDLAVGIVKTQARMLEV